MGAGSHPQGQNLLSREKSPYLLQHADNPVNWYPWGEEAFARARDEDKPIFLSVGYATCHWCHVMAHESFEDVEVARLMNETFISIKLDREERPDIDQVYMSVCQMMTGGGGWPLTILMTPDLRPFFAATYIPRTSRNGRVGMLELVPRIKELWATRRAELDQMAQRITSSLQHVSSFEPGLSLASPTLDKAYDQLASQFDPLHGGFGTAPKFPTPHVLSFLLRYARRHDETRAMEMVETTLRAMRRGGIYDHVGFGFHRYSTDDRWRVPHFEKMLYDQALLAMAYVEAHLATGGEAYARTAREIFTYVLRDLTDEAGGFYSAEDADSDGQEGKFYLWTDAEIRSVLSEEDARLVAAVFNIQTQGNFREESTGARIGANILYRARPLPRLAEELQLDLPLLELRLERARQLLFAARLRRVRPQRDDKILTDWNGLMIAALAIGARALGEERYAEAAARAATFILDRMRAKSGRLLHRFRDSEAGIDAMLDDHAFLIWGLIELYETTFEPSHLRAALELNDQLLERFWDEAQGGFFATADDAERLLVRQKSIYDGAVPSGNSVAMWNLMRLARLCGRTDLENRADRVGRAFSGRVRSVPSVHTQFMIALDFGVAPTQEVVIAGDPQSSDTRAMVQALHRRFLPHALVLLRPTGESEPEVTRLAPFTKDHAEIDGRPAAYVCRENSCQRPTTEIATMLELLEQPAD